MQSSSNHIWILFLCLTLIIDDLHAVKLRMAPLRVSATFSKKPDCTKKKNQGSQTRDKTIPIGIYSPMENEEL